MQTTSRDGKFIISASDDSKTGCRLISRGEDENSKFDKENDVYLQAKEPVNLYDVAHAIWFDCFSNDGIGLRLLAKKLKCHVTVKEKTYLFTVEESNSLDFVLGTIAGQINL